MEPAEELEPSVTDTTDQTRRPLRALARRGPAVARLARRARPRRRRRRRRRHLRHRRRCRRPCSRRTCASGCPTWAFYSEDGGLQGAADPELILIVDPIDGTRPAAAGFEMACVSVAAVPPVARRPRWATWSPACVQEIKSGDLFVAEKGAGFSMTRAAGDDLPLLAHRPDRPREPLLDARLSRPARRDPRAASSRSSSTSRRWAARCSTSAPPRTRSRASSPASSTPTSTSARRSSPRILPSRPSSGASGAATCSATRPTTWPPCICSARRPASRSATPTAGRSTTSRCSARTPRFQMACIASGNAALQAALVEVVQRGIRELRYEA